jgi:hypothetical protein
MAHDADIIQCDALTSRVAVVDATSVSATHDGLGLLCTIASRWLIDPAADNTRAVR